MKKITILTASDAVYAPLKDISRPNLEKWAKFQGYNFQHRNITKEVKNKSFYKIRLILNEFIYNEPEYIMWFDIDSLVCNMNFNLTNIIDTYMRYPETNILTAADNWGICCSHMIIEKTCWVRNFLDTLLTLDLAYESKREEQDSIKILYNNYFSVAKHIQYIQNFVTHSEYDTIKSGDIAHYPNIPLEERVKLMKETKIIEYEKNI